MQLAPLSNAAGIRETIAEATVAFDVGVEIVLQVVYVGV